MEIFPPLRKTVSPLVKNYDNLSVRLRSPIIQLLTRHLLYLAPGMNDNVKKSRLLPVSTVLI